MHRARWLIHLLFASLLLSATLAHAQETPATESGAPRESTEQPTPLPSEGDALPAEADRGVNDPTWFGMGFESRRDRFRRDMSTSSGGHGGAGGGRGNGGNGGNGFGR